MVVASPPLPDNATLAANLREFADVLTQHEADGFRISADRRAADVVASLTQPVGEILKTSGREGLRPQLDGNNSGARPALGQYIHSVARSFDRHPANDRRASPL